MGLKHHPYTSFEPEKKVEPALTALSNTWQQNSGKNGRGLGTSSHDMDVWWMFEGCCQTTNVCVTNLRVSFLLVKLSVLNLVNTWGPA